MDAGVLQLHVFPDDPAYEPMKLAEGETIQPSLSRDTPVRRVGQVSLIVPTFFNDRLKAGALAHLLDRIEACECVQEIVLVAADGETRSLETYLNAKADAPVKIVSCEQNRRSQSRNVGVTASSKEILLFLDDDMLLQDWRLVDVILSEMLEGDYDCALFPRRHFIKFPLLYRPEAVSNLVSAWRSGNTDLPEEYFLDPVRDGSAFKTMAFCFPGCFMMIRRDAFDRIGGFPEAFEGWGFEDTDFAMRAVRQLRVMNLFRTAPPLLHIDHPVSPYKSDEYRRNFRQFSSAYNTSDMDWLCRRVFVGEDFLPTNRAGCSSDQYVQPMADVLERYPLPVPRDRVLRSFLHVVTARLKRGLDPTPAYILLHGSRGAGTHRLNSDHDLLVLFRGGGYAEHFVSMHHGSTVEIESSGLAKFEQLTSAPAVHPARSPLELAKLAQARVLWGVEEDFKKWRSEIIDIGIHVGLPVWLLYGIGMRAASEAYAGFLPLYFEAVSKLLQSPPSDSELLGRIPGATRSAASVKDLTEPVGAPLGTAGGLQLAAKARPELDVALLLPERAGELISATRDLLDEELPEWRSDMADSKRVFAVQVPEIWTALHLLLEAE